MSAAETAAVRDLARIPAVYAQLGDALVPGAASGDGERVSGGGGLERPAPANLEVADHRHQLVRGLRWWTRTADELLTFRPHTLGDRPAGTLARPATMCAWLTVVVPLLPPARVRELAGNLADWLTVAARHTSGRQETRVRLVPLPAPCLSTTDLYTCPGALHAAIPAARGRQPWLTCRECRGRWPVADLPDAANVTVPVHEAADLLGVDVRTIRRRAARAHGLVRLGDAMRADCAL